MTYWIINKSVNSPTDVTRKEKANINALVLRLEGKRFVQGVCYFINKFLNLYIRKEVVNVQNTNSILSELC